MKLAIFGATGHTGRYILSQALAAGHTIQVLARTPDKLGEFKDKVTVILGAVEDAAAVDQTIAGVDAVISVLGHTQSAPDMQTIAMHNIVAAMHHHEIRRVVSLTGAGVPAEGDTPSIFDKVLTLGLRMFAPARLKDGLDHRNVLAASGLDWTIVRVPLLTDGTPVAYKVGHVGESGMGMKISRANVAEFMLHIAETGEYIGKLPYIAQY